MRFLVTGATGMIGQGLCAHLASAGHEIAFLDHRETSRDARMGRRVTNLTELGSAEIDVVVNLAGSNMARIPWTAEGKQQFLDSRVGTTDRLAQWIGSLKQPPRLLISASAIGYYGDRGDDVLTEESAPGRGFSSELCQVWERAAGRARSPLTRVVSLRIGLVCSSRGGAFSRVAQSLAEGGTLSLGDADRWISWIVDSDLFELVSQLCERPGAEGVYNATAPVPVRREQFTDSIAAALGRRAAPCESSSSLRERLGEMAEILTASQRVLPARALAEGLSFLCPDIGMAARKLAARSEEVTIDAAVRT